MSDFPVYKLGIVNYPFFRDYPHTRDLVTMLRKRCSIDFLEIPASIQQENLARALAGFHFIITSTYPNFWRRFFELNKDVLLIARHGIGCDNIDTKAAEREGVYVIRVPGQIEREAIAEHTIGLMLAALRRIVKANAAVKSGRAKVAVYHTHFVQTFASPDNLSSLTIGIVGLGNIGSRLAEILVSGFGAKVLAYDPYVAVAKMESLGVEAVGTINELFQRSDIISIHASLTEETKHLIDRSVFEKGKRGIILVNTARSEITNPRALLWALSDGIVTFAALDVFESEPLPEDHPLLKMDNVILTPHIAAFTHATQRNMFRAISNAIVNYLDGKSIVESAEVVASPKKPRVLQKLNRYSAAANGIIDPQ